MALSECGYGARDEMLRVLKESGAPEVRAACVQGLGSIEDLDSVDLMLDLLGDESLLVRSSAGAAVTSIFGRMGGNTQFDASASSEVRIQAVEQFRSEWEELRDSPLLNRYRRELQKGREE